MYQDQVDTGLSKVKESEGNVDQMVHLWREGRGMGDFLIPRECSSGSQFTMDTVVNEGYRK